jgi:hypothetical protein
MKDHATHANTAPCAPAAASAQYAAAAPGGMTLGKTSGPRSTLQAQIGQTPRMLAQSRALQAALPASPELPPAASSSPRQLKQRGQLAQLQAATAPAPAPASAQGGLPAGLRNGIESLSGMDMSDVRVHRNSSKPAALQAHAYAQGRDIHLGPGQEKHLPHEAWHVVQQTQGRVSPTLQLTGGVPVNDDRALETEADVMGARALRNTVQRQLTSTPTNAARSAPVLQGAFWEKVGDDYVWHGGEVQPDETYSATAETRRGGSKGTKKKDYQVYIKNAGDAAEDPAEDVVSDEEQAEPVPTYAASFEASGNGTHALSVVTHLATQMAEDDFYDIQVGFYEEDGELMPGTTANVERLMALEESENVRGRLRIRVNYGRDAMQENSPTRYDAVSVRNIMAGNPDGSSDTSFGSNDPLARGVIGAQSEKLKSGGRLHFAASGRPYFKPGDHRDHYADRVKVDNIAAQSGLTRQVPEEYSDAQVVKKNHGAKNVGVSGTYTRVYSKA